MPEKYHIETKPIPPRLPRVGKFGVVDWREDCGRCHNCAKKACIYNRHEEEARYIQNLNNVDALFFDCMGCFSCVQNCTKGLLSMSLNPSYEMLGNHYWTPEIIQTTWLQAETAKVPVSGAGYRGKFSGPGFDSMWTDMSEIVRPTRDGIHGREYISTSVDIGRKVSHLNFDGNNLVSATPVLIDIPLPLILDMVLEEYSLAKLEPALIETAVNTGLIVIIDSEQSDELNNMMDEKHLRHIAFHIASGAALPSKELLSQTRLVEVADDGAAIKRIKELKAIEPGIVVSVRVKLDGRGVERVLELAENENVEAIHFVADMNGDEIGVERPSFVKEMIREIHTTLINRGTRDEITLIAGGGIALPEHMAKAMLCGADLTSTYLPLLIGLECHLCKVCKPGRPCPAKLETIDPDYSVGRMTNLVAAWHSQFIEVMGAMGMREARRLRGDAGRALFFEELEEQSFGRLFGLRK